ncbi:hypothetical protein IWQ60_007220 [Tieghemiomyces parasiticus]|uniref:RNA polymerase II elongation factor ELL N-terminal domain-containing protein n=1 Tax=Tieghemiomyces parasiticus TaxID=78921 RepID=A0A9W7ZZ19_9FUNG|nr:hypothetical protein IWQ60_007220 [Tieghemiomyces parasiticus]
MLLDEREAQDINRSARTAAAAVTRRPASRTLRAPGSAPLTSTTTTPVATPTASATVTTPAATASLGVTSPGLVGTGGPGIPLRTRLIQKLALRPERTDALVAAVKAKRDDVLAVLVHIAKSGKAAADSPDALWSLLDDAYREVKIFDWPQYVAQDRANVVKRAGAAFDRLRLPPDAPERSKLTPLVKAASFGRHIPPAAAAMSAATTTKTEPAVAAAAAAPSPTLTSRKRKPTTSTPESTVQKLVKISSKQGWQGAAAGNSAARSSEPSKPALQPEVTAIRSPPVPALKRANLAASTTSTTTASAVPVSSRPPPSVSRAVSSTTGTVAATSPAKRKASIVLTADELDAHPDSPRKLPRKPTISNGSTASPAQASALSTTALRPTAKLPTRPTPLTPPNSVESSAPFPRRKPVSKTAKLPDAPADPRPASATDTSSVTLSDSPPNGTGSQAYASTASTQTLSDHSSLGGSSSLSHPRSAADSLEVPRISSRAELKLRTDEFERRYSEYKSLYDRIEHLRPIFDEYNARLAQARGTDKELALLAEVHHAFQAMDGNKVAQWQERYNRLHRWIEGTKAEIWRATRELVQRDRVAKDKVAAAVTTNRPTKPTRATVGGI